MTQNEDKIFTLGVRSFSKFEFLKECMVKTAAILCPESKNKFQNKAYHTVR